MACRSPTAPQHDGATASPSAVTIDHVPASSGAYVGSPSIAVLPDGSYVSSHDLFGPGTANDQTVVFGSADRGAHWATLSQVAGQWWSTLFVHEGRLYLLGTSNRFGHIVIRRSEDGGRTWVGATLTRDAGYHCAPVPVIEQGGKVWRAFERRSSGGPFKAFVISAPADANLLDAASWTFSRSVSGDETWLDGQFENWLEGNVVVAQGGQIVDILRVDSKSDVERVAVVRVTADGGGAQFDPTTDFVGFPGGSKKFTIRFDPRAGVYWSLTNTVPQPHTGGHTDRIRNTLSLVSSPDLTSWTERSVILHHADTRTHAFQYADWLFDGEDLIAVSRTADDDSSGGAHSAHDANYLTFHRIPHFRAP